MSAGDPYLADPGRASGPLLAPARRKKEKEEETAKESSNESDIQSAAGQ
ncbi:hypothetical protein QP568_01310 [Propionimicrobium lymphophilum]|nr:hypothetical protein [Propionimicrobium lymphophilum]MDK7709109.1 hypothetical protein [Propionimicrobium lymphophilum]MDK7732944.1 hypothetical protein [Propionimicrobium lymphophilum]